MVCKNCDTVLNEETKFCNECGAKIIRNRLTIKSLFENFSEQFLNYDNKFIQTFISLFTKPCDVIEGYINGTRKKYVNVISYFAIAITISGVLFFILNKFYPEVLSSLYSMQNAEPQQIEINTKVSNFIRDYQSMLMFAFVPIMAVLSRLVFLKNKKYNFAEHLIINLYSYSQVSIISSLLMLFSVSVFNSISPYILNFIYLFQFIYFAFILKRLYNLTLKKIILKSLLFILLAIIIFIPIMIIISVLLYFGGFYDGVIEATKEKKGIGYIVSSALNWIS